MPRVILAAVFLVTAAVTASAQAFHDLPGVVTTEQHERKDPVSCTSRYIPPPENSTRQHFGRTVYDCVRGDVTYSGTDTPQTGARTWRDW